MPNKFDSVNSGSTIKFFKVDPSNGNLFEQTNFNSPSGFGTGMASTPICAVALPGTTSGTFDRVHVYFLSTGSSSSEGILSERYWTPSGGWSTGNISSTLSYACQSTTSIAANMWIQGSDLQIRVYVTNTAGNIAEIGFGYSPTGWVVIRTVG